MAFDDPAILIAKLKEVFGTDPADDTQKGLTPLDFAIIYHDGTGYVMADGSATKPIKLPNMEQITSGSISELMIVLGDGSLARLDAKSGVDKWILTSNNDGFQLEPFKNGTCFDEDDVQECQSTYLAGLCLTEIDGENYWCLTRVPLSEFEVSIPPNEWADTSCITITGQGTSGDPYKATIKISEDVGNFIECRDDGLFVQDCCTYGSDPLGELI